MSETTQDIARRLRELRELSDLSLAEMAGRLNLSAETYAAYEAGREDIPASDLNEAARIMKVDLGLLLTGSTPRMGSFAVTRRSKGPGVERRKGYGYENLAANFKDAAFEPFVVTLPPTSGDMPPPANAHPGQEFSYVLEGRMELAIRGQSMTLEPGDSVMFDANEPHGMRALDGKPARFLAVITA